MLTLKELWDQNHRINSKTVEGETLWEGGRGEGEKGEEVGYIQGGEVNRKGIWDNP